MLNLSVLHPQVVQTLEDHHQEVLSLYRDYGFAGLIAQDSEFALCNVPAYFSSHALKLSWNGKNLTTHQYLLSEAARQLGLKTQHLPCFAALLGRERHTHTHSCIPQLIHPHTPTHKIRHIFHSAPFVAESEAHSFGTFLLRVQQTFEGVCLSRRKPYSA